MFFLQVGARALAALQQGVDPNGINQQQQFLVYPTVGGIPMIISTDPAQQQLTKVKVRIGKHFLVFQFF